MKKEMKLMIGILILGFVILLGYKFLNKPKLDAVEEPKQPTIQEYEREPEVIPDEITEKSPVENVLEKEEGNEEKKQTFFGIKTNNKKHNKPNNNQTNNTDKNKPSILPDESTPDNNEKLEDLIITRDMINNNSLNISNKKYNSIIIKSDIEENTRIILDTVQVKNSLILEKPNKYQLDLIKSNISSLTTTNKEQQKSLFRMNLFTIKNKDLAGPTINLQDGTTLQSAIFNTNAEMNGTTKIPNVEVNDGKEFSLNIPIENATTNVQGVIAVNQKINKLTNLKKNAAIIINAPVNILENKESSNIYVNNKNSINQLNNSGENTIISGNGTIVNSKISANNTRIYTNIINQPKYENNADILVRQEKNIEIVSAKSKAQGEVTFTLNEAINNLSIKDISVICNRGKNITLYNLISDANDNKTYTLTTSYFKNDSYALYITLPNGNIISKDFATDYANPTINNAVVERISQTEATLELYGLDEGGNIYYILNDVTSTEKLDTSYIKRNGKSATVKVGYNKITFKDLEPNKEYNLYYAIEGFYENISQVNGPTLIPKEIKTIPSTKYQIVRSAEETPNHFAFTLNRIPEKELTLEDFEIKCPSQKNLTLKNAEFIVSPDLKTYIIIVPDNYGHKDNKYTFTIQVAENEKVEGSFVSHFDPPTITNTKITRFAENTAEFSFSSDEEGTVYYGIYEWNGGIYDYNTSTPFASDVISNVIKDKKTAKLNTGKNTITIDLTGIKVRENTSIWALFIDNAGNYRLGFVDHHKIPTTINPEKPTPESTLKITDFTATTSESRTYIRIKFNEEIQPLSNDDIQLSVAGNGSLPNRLTYSTYSEDEENGKPIKSTNIDILNYGLPTGTYELTLKVKKADGSLVQLTKTFEIA